jgi:hypothetical protein
MLSVVENIPPDIRAVIIAAIIATIVAPLTIYFKSQPANAAVRQIFLVLINLNPWTIGTWRSEFSKREVFFAAWFLVFLLVFIVLFSAWL